MAQEKQATGRSQPGRRCWLAVMRWTQLNNLFLAVVLLGSIISWRNTQVVTLAQASIRVSVRVSASAQNERAQSNSVGRRPAPYLRNALAHASLDTSNLSGATLTRGYIERKCNGHKHVNLNISAGFGTDFCFGFFFWNLARGAALADEPKRYPPVKKDLLPTPFFRSCVARSQRTSTSPST